MATDTQSIVSTLEEQVGRVLLGKPEPIRLTVVALLAGGHILIEDTPGVGKTSLAKAVARSVDCVFARIQFTPDLLPSDILGANIYKTVTGEFEFRKGPIFTNILLADEINRTTPRTQSALLEAMSEKQVSIDGTTYVLERPFFVIATQNPFEFEGTYPLPENQLDRFMICTSIGFPDRSVEMEVLKSHRNGEAVDTLKPIMSHDQLSQLKQDVLSVEVDDSINDYILDIIEATRTDDDLELGVSTRGALTLYRAVQAMALIENRKFVIPDDVKRLAVPVLAHRVVSKGVIREQGRERAVEIINHILKKVTVPS